MIKRPYNDPDVTVNIEIIADPWITDTEGISIKGGEGVGQVTKPVMSGAARNRPLIPRLRR